MLAPYRGSLVLNVLNSRGTSARSRSSRGAAPRFLWQPGRRTYPGRPFPADLTPWPPLPSGRGRAGDGMGVHRAIAEKPPIPRPLPPDFGGKGGLFLMSSASLARRGRRSFCRWQSLPIEGDGGGLCHLAGPIVLLVPLCKRLRAARTLDRRSSPWAASLPRFRSAFGASPPFPPKSGGRGRGLGGLRANEPPWLGKARSAHRSPTGIGSKGDTPLRRRTMKQGRPARAPGCRSRARKRRGAWECRSCGSAATGQAEACNCAQAGNAR
jgi:hypothetical protein